MGVTVETTAPGDGKTFPKNGQTVVIHYSGWLTDGNGFDSTRYHGVWGTPFEFKIGLGLVTKGLDEGIAQMSKGQKAKLTCTPDYGFGEKGYPPKVPPNATVIFDVELLDVK